MPPKYIRFSVSRFEWSLNHDQNRSVRALPYITSSHRQNRYPNPGDADDVSTQIPWSRSAAYVVMTRVRRDPILVDFVGFFTRIHAGRLRHFNAEVNQAPPE